MIKGTTIGAIKGDTRSLDNSSCGDEVFRVCSLAGPSSFV